MKPHHAKVAAVFAALAAIITAPVVVGGSSAVTQTDASIEDMLARLECAVFGECPITPPPTPEESPTTKPEPDSCRGVKVAAGQDLEAIVESTGAGATFCIEAGTYAVSTTGLTMQSGDAINGEGLHPQGKPGAEDPPVKIEGKGFAVFVGSDANNVTLQDLDITDAPANSTCSSSTTCAEASRANTGWSFINVRFHHIDAQAVGGFDNRRDITFDNVEIDHVGNRFTTSENNGFAAGIKGTDGYTVRDSYVHDTNQGIWCDRDCDGDRFIVTGSIIEDNCSFGIHYENTYFLKSTAASALIEGNTVRGNGWCNPPGS